MTLRLLFVAATLALTSLSGPAAADQGGSSPQSSGAVNAGRLTNASRLRNSRYIRLRFPQNAWGSRRLVGLIEQCAKAVHKRHKGAHKLMVGDLSHRRGGMMRPHSGHQNGREADFGFYMRSGRPLGGLWRVGAGHIDARRTLTYLECLIDSGDVMQVFLDRQLQRPLYDEARKRGWSEGRLSRTFSFPRRASARTGIVQHRRGHNNHLHVRLKCAPYERACQDQPVVGSKARGKKKRGRRPRGKRR